LLLPKSIGSSLRKSTSANEFGDDSVNPFQRTDGMSGRSSLDRTDSQSSGIPTIIRCCEQDQNENERPFLDKMSMQMVLNPIVDPSCSPPQSVSRSSCDHFDSTVPSKSYDEPKDRPSMMIQEMLRQPIQVSTPQYASSTRELKLGGVPIKKRKLWREEDMQSAMEMVKKTKISTRKAADRFHVPHSTLWHRLTKAKRMKKSDL
jgi:hypothetical protein